MDRWGNVLHFGILHFLSAFCLFVYSLIKRWWIKQKWKIRNGLSETTVNKIVSLKSWYGTTDLTYFLKWIHDEKSVEIAESIRNVKVKHGCSQDWQRNRSRRSLDGECFSFSRRFPPRTNLRVAGIHLLFMAFH